MQIIPFQKSSAAPGIAQYMQKSRLKRIKEALLVNKWPVLSPEELDMAYRRQLVAKLTGQKK